MQWTTWSELHTLHTRMCGGEGVDGGAAFGICDLPYGRPRQPHTMTKRFVAQMCKFLAKCHPKKAYHLLTTAPRHRPIHPLLHSTRFCVRDFKSAALLYPSKNVAQSPPPPPWLWLHTLPCRAAALCECVKWRKKEKRKVSKRRHGQIFSINENRKSWQK